MMLPDPAIWISETPRPSGSNVIEAPSSACNVGAPNPVDAETVIGPMDDDDPMDIDTDNEDKEEDDQKATSWRNGSTRLATSIWSSTASILSGNE